MIDFTQDEDARKQLRIYSILMTAISCLLLSFMLAIAMLTDVFMMMPLEMSPTPFGAVPVRHESEYFYNGVIGALWAIIAGPIGIHISNSKKLHQIKCLWNAYIPLIAIGILCTISGFGLGVNGLVRLHSTLTNSTEIYMAYGGINWRITGGLLEVRPTVKALIALLYIETLVLFVLLIVSVFANCRFSPCSKICAAAEQSEDTVINDHNNDNENIDNNVRNDNVTNEYNISNNYNEYNEYDQYAEYGRNKEFRRVPNAKSNASFFI